MEWIGFYRIMEWKVLCDSIPPAPPDYTEIVMISGFPLSSVTFPH